MACLGVLGLFLAGLVGLLGYSAQHGDAARLTHAFDYKGELCGGSQAASDRSFVYWCGAGEMQESGLPTALDLQFPTCVAACPADASHEMACLGVEQVQVDTSGEGPFLEEKTIITQSTVKQMSYPSTPVAGRYCVPRPGAGAPPGSDALAKSLMGKDGPIGNPWRSSADAAGSLAQCWVAVTGVLLVAIGLGYSFLVVAKRYPAALAETVLWLLVAACSLAGCCLLSGDVLRGEAHESWRRSNVIFRVADPDAAALRSRLAGAALLLLGACLGFAATEARGALRESAGCVQAACECIFEMPSLLCQPAIEAVLKLAVAAVLLRGAMLLLSSADMVPDFIDVHGQQVGGLTHSLQFSDWSAAMVVYYAFALAWLIELMGAISHFVTSYSVVLWYYTPKPKGGGPSIPLVRGFIVGAVFHLGTLALGSFLICLCRPARALLGVVARKWEGPAGGPVSSVLREYLEFLNRNAYIDVCISSTGFCAAARNVSGFVASEGGKVEALWGCLWAYGLACVAGIGAVGGGMALSLAASREDVVNPLFVACIAASLSGCVAASFAGVLEHASDALLYAYVWNKSHGHNTVQKYAPDSLACLTEYRPLAKFDRGCEHAPVHPSSGGMFGAFSNFFQGRSDSKMAAASAEETAALMQMR